MGRLNFKCGFVLTVVFACGMSGFSQTKTQYLDSIVEENSRKNVFSYDNEGNNLSLEKWILDTIGKMGIYV